MSYQNDTAAMRLKATQIETAVSTQHLGALLKTHPAQLLWLATHPPYQVFYVAKHDGSKRLIEAPTDKLKQVLKRLNSYLQSAYYFRRTEAAYGFVQTPKGDLCPRSIVTAAQQHCGCRYLLNIDLKDFFYQISTEETEAIFREEYFRFDNDAAALLARLTTYNGRLTMGSPTSPAITNFAFLKADELLLSICRQHRITFTRYVDDCSFSSQQPISEAFYKQIESALHEHRFYLNYEKVKWYGKDDEKRITGLVVDEKVYLPPDFLTVTQQDIQRLKSLLEVQAISGYSATPEMIREFEQMVRGKVAFINQVYGGGSEVAAAYYKQLEAAYQTEAYYESRSWLDFNYGW